MWTALRPGYQYLQMGKLGIRNFHNVVAVVYSIFDPPPPNPPLLLLQSYRCSSMDVAAWVHFAPLTNVGGHTQIGLAKRGSQREYAQDVMCLACI